MNKTRNKETKKDHSDHEEKIQVKTYIFNPKHTVQDLANIFQVSNIFLIKKLLKIGVKTNINQVLSRENIELLGLELNIEIIHNTRKVVLDSKHMTQKKGSNLIQRIPIVTIMGHVDHGKTTLLDVIRKTRVVDQEFGGITQHIGAYEVTYQNSKITFIDSPGHEAFQQMRSRGAQITDICVIVVACDDGVKPQTIESIKHAKNAQVNIIIAINKIDKPNNKKENIMSELSQLGLIPEEWGGNTPYIEISALKQQGINTLLETICLISEMKNIQVDLSQDAEGTVLEASLIKNKGPVATLILSQGILKIGDIIVAGCVYGKVRFMENNSKKAVFRAFPSQPIVIYGFKQIPQAGDNFIVVPNEKKAKQITEKRQQLHKENKQLSQLQQSALAKVNVFPLKDEKPKKNLNVILKTDTQGIIEAIQKILEPLNIEGIKVYFVKKSVGMVTNNDIMLANACDAIIINFNTILNNDLIQLAHNLKVEIKTYNILYKIVEDIQQKLKILVKPVLEEKVTGQAEIRKIFYISTVGYIAGCYVVNGVIYSNSLAKVIRNNAIIYQGKIISLKHLKNNISIAPKNSECGIVLDNFNTFQISDIIESSRMEESLNNE
ncbi:translation initiation factor IF-2 [Candidatus Phytoplasma melaleucae]|uniref:Translation initiation factor IF-2 n=1 Tax=Candidatus Phytoplasma melaleucae TaxID=2982630 RepID=A0ABT9DDN9_9MOLU|nr:translation initiation factor IF-2 ['Melaleuca sp.' phytoplasma]MDO8167959.1 translation initiation factor IF-2 ['Melaleuca sp.' phytoplasma]MDV3205405.1 translation initiation factor IF-2 [Weeping tea tree witches'-broom phytoplasma]